MKDREEACSFDGIDDFGVKSLLTPLYEPRGGGGGGGGVTTYNGLYGEAPPERGTAFSGSGFMRG